MAEPNEMELASELQTWTQRMRPIIGIWTDNDCVDACGTIDRQAEELKAKDTIIDRLNKRLDDIGGQC